MNDVIAVISAKFGAFWYMSHYMSQMMSYDDDIIARISKKFVTFWYQSRYVTSVTEVSGVTLCDKIIYPLFYSIKYRYIG
jgi:hypothetical protein